MSVYIDNLSGYVYMCHYICLPAYAYMYTSLLATRCCYIPVFTRTLVCPCLRIHIDIHTCMRIHGSCDVSPFNEFQALKRPHRNALAIQAWPDQLFHWMMRVEALLLWWGAIEELPGQPSQYMTRVDKALAAARLLLELCVLVSGLPFEILVAARCFRVACPWLGNTSPIDSANSASQYRSSLCDTMSRLEMSESAHVTTFWRCDSLFDIWHGNTVETCWFTWFSF